MDKASFRGKADVCPEYLEDMEMTLDEYIKWQIPTNSHKDGWVYGQVVYSGDKAWIVGELIGWSDEYIVHEWWMPINPETVGQLVRKHKRYVVYFGDILQDDSSRYLVVWDETECGYAAIDLADGCQMCMSEVQGAWVVGNRWDNPELLEVR